MQNKCFFLHIFSKSERALDTCYVALLCAVGFFKPKNVLSQDEQHVQNASVMTVPGESKVCARRSWFCCFF